jgi:hypothetical protein
VKFQIPCPFIHTVFSEYSLFSIHHILCYVTARRVLLFGETGSKSSKPVEITPFIPFPAASPPQIFVKNHQTPYAYTRSLGTHGKGLYDYPGNGDTSFTEKGGRSCREK